MSERVAYKRLTRELVARAIHPTTLKLVLAVAQYGSRGTGPVALRALGARVALAVGTLRQAIDEATKEGWLDTVTTEAGTEYRIGAAYLKACQSLTQGADNFPAKSVSNFDTLSGACQELTQADANSVSSLDTRIAPEPEPEPGTPVALLAVEESKNSRKLHRPTDDVAVEAPPPAKAASRRRSPPLSDEEQTRRLEVWDGLREITLKEPAGYGASRFGLCVKQLVRAGADYRKLADEAEGFRAYFRTQDWRGRGTATQDGRLPEPHEVVAEWPRYEAWLANGRAALAPAVEAKGNGRPKDAAERQADRARRNRELLSDQGDLEDFAANVAGLLGTGKGAA